MPTREAITSKRRRGRPPRHRPPGRRTTVDADEPSSTAGRVHDDNNDRDDTGRSGGDSDTEELPRGRILRKRGRPKRSATPVEELDSKRRRDDSEMSFNAESEIDEAGERKIDKHGRLSGGRTYKVPTFTLPTRGDQVLMFAMEPAKLLNYRDSYLFFQKNPLLERVRLTEEERNWLVDKRLLVHWFRNRDVAVVTARSCFKCFGSKIIHKGKRVKDDYFEARALQEGTTDETENDSDDGESGKNARRMLISRHAQSNEYDSLTPVTNATWLHHAALAVRGFNAQLYERRAEKTTFYDIHTNVLQVASATQPTSCKFECVGGTNTEFSIGPVQFEDASSSKPKFKGIGRDLLDGSYDHKAVIKALPEDLLQSAKHIVDSEDTVAVSKTSDAYPIALMEGQYQESFPVHFTRFGQQAPKIAPPSVVAANAQSLFAQQQYFHQIFQATHTMPPFVDPNMRAAPSPGAPLAPSLGHPGAPPQPRLPTGTPQAQSPAQHSKSNYPSQAPYTPSPKSQNTSVSEASYCNHITPNGQPCRQAAMFPGGKCQAHASAATAKSTAGAETKPPAYTENTCAKCSFLSAPNDLLPDDGNPLCDPFTMIKCAKCNQKYHPVCQQLKTPRQLATVESYPWTCEDCKICCVCKTVGDESQLMMCDACDRGWHTGCCNPKVDKVPEESWMCPLCASCHSCDEQGDKVKYHQVTVPPSNQSRFPIYLVNYCEKCHTNFENDRFCPVCLKTFAEDEENDDEDNQMVMCDACDHWIHTICDETLTPEKYQSLCDNEDAEYTCPLCANRSKPLANSSSALSALKGESAPSGYCIGLLGGKVRTRGVVTLNGVKMAVPEINGTGIAEMPS